MSYSTVVRKDASCVFSFLKFTEASFVTQLILAFSPFYFQGIGLSLLSLLWILFQLAWLFPFIYLVLWVSALFYLCSISLSFHHFFLSYYIWGLLFLGFWRRKWQPTPVLLALKNPMDGGAWCRLLSMGSQKVGHNWVTSLHFTFLGFRVILFLPFVFYPRCIRLVQLFV